MSQDPAQTEFTYYEIQVSGRLSPEWAEWFGNLAIRVTSAPDGSIYTILSGPVIDQAALFGLLTRIRDLGLKLIAVNSRQPGLVEGIHVE